MKKYETVVVLRCSTDEETTAALLAKFKDLIAKNGTIESVEEWGKRKLAYPINDQNEGYYALIKFSCEHDFPAELDRVYKITDGVLRTLIIAQGE
ncbi:MAG: 30S ribosomal protein S6 [Pygmaiobacter sp.]